MKKILAGIVIALLAGNAYADRVDDAMKSRAAFCHLKYQAVIYGAYARGAGMPLTFKKSEESKVDNDAIYMKGPMTEQETDFAKKYITEGWQMMDGYLKKHPQEEAATKTVKLIGISKAQCEATRSL
jgi:hypothetical protein